MRRFPALLRATVPIAALACLGGRCGTVDIPRDEMGDFTAPTGDEPYDPYDFYLDLITAACRLEGRCWHNYFPSSDACEEAIIKPEGEQEWLGPDGTPCDPTLEDPLLQRACVTAANQEQAEYAAVCAYYGTSFLHVDTVPECRGLCLPRF